MASKIEPPHLAKLLDRQAHLWQIRQRATEEGGEAARRELAHLKEGPWVSVSRQLGSGGDDLARRIAERLDWQVYDKEILEEIATHTHAKGAVLSRLDEREVGWLEDSLKSVLHRATPGQGVFLQEMIKVIWTLGRKGRTVIVGRGANWVLDARFGLRIRVVAPLELRVERLAQRERCSPAEARERLRSDDQERARFVRHAFAREIEDPLGYDYVVNTEFVEVETTAEGVVSALRRKLLADEHARSV
jgi:cytidylate kinase